MVSWLFFYLCLSLLQVSCSQPCETKTLRQNRLGPPGPTNINDFFASFADDVGEAGPECLNITVEEGDYIVTEGGNITISANGTVRLVFTRVAPEVGIMMPSSLLIGDVNFFEFAGIDFDGSFGFIGFYNVTNVVIRESRFRQFQEGTLDFTDCTNILIENTRFQRNGMDKIGRSRTLQGGSGGLSIQYLAGTSFNGQIQFHIRNVTFSRNIAGLNQNLSNSGFTEVTSGNFYTGRGGAIFILLQNEAPVEGSIESCQFLFNNASLYGGAVYIAFNSLSVHNITITNSNFTRNEAVLAGGAVMVTYQEGGDDEFVNSVVMNGCRLNGNSAEYGGAVYFFVSITSGREDGELGTYASFTSCIFMANSATNYGSAIGATALNLFESKGDTKPAEITNCTFIKNKSTSGTTIGITNFPFIFQGTNVIIDSMGPGLIVVGALVKFGGTINFINNTVRELNTGVLLFLSNGQIELMRNAVVNILGNKGGWGAGIVPTIVYSPSAYTKLIGNPLCSFLYEDQMLPPDDWQVNMTFNGNTAIVGSAVYVNNLHLCSWVGQTTFDLNRAYRWKFIKFGPDNMNIARPGRSDSEIYDVQTQAVNTSAVPRVEGFPGSRVTLDIASFGETGNLTYAIWRFQALGNDDIILFDPSAVPSRDDLQRSITVTFYLRNNVKLGPGNRLEVPVQATTLLNEEESRTTFKVSVRGCPAGNILASIPGNTYYGCLCNLDRSDITNCLDETIYIANYKWAALSRDEVDDLFIIDCPHGYCKCTIRDSGEPDNYYCHYEYAEDSPNRMCSCDRKGILCGECLNGTGVSVLLNRCTTCHDAFSILIVVLIVADIAQFIMILVLMFSLPDWYISSLFYLQILPLLTLYFPETFEHIRPYLYYVASFFSFYFPYDFCLYSNMSTLASYSLKFIPALCAMVVIPSVLFIRDCLLKHKVRPAPHHGVFDIILSTYTPTLYAAVSVFNCVQVPISNGNDTSRELRWFHDGSVKCFAGGHIGLSILAFIIILTCSGFLITFLVFSFDGIKSHRCFRYGAESINFHYKDKYFFWAFAELFKRTVLIILITVIPSNITMLLIVLMLFVGLQAIFEPYKTRLGNTTDFILGCLVTVLLLVSRIVFFLESLHYNEYTFSSNDTSDTYLSTNGKCGVDLEITPLVTLLGILYYLPFVVMVAIAVGSITIHTYQYYFKKQHSDKMKSKNVKEMATLQRMRSTRGDVEEQRARAGTTYITRSHSDTPISPRTLEASVEIDWTPRSERVVKRSIRKKGSQREKESAV